ncbi:MAG TPA: DUF6498-containing protein [Dehalococcoidales bacterium]
MNPAPALKEQFVRLRSNLSLLLKPSVIVLLIANLMPLYGVIFLDWEISPLLLLFWLENVALGIYNVLKMVIATPDNRAIWFAKIIFIPFFCFHYGMFTLVHGVFVFGLFGGYFTQNAPFPDLTALVRAVRDYHLELPVLVLILSHGISFVLNYLGRSEYRQASLTNLMQQPYSRVVLLHITILVGGFLLMSLGSPVFGLLLLAVCKTVLDVRAHIKEHYRPGFTQKNGFSI